MAELGNFDGALCHLDIAEDGATVAVQCPEPAVPGGILCRCHLEAARGDLARYLSAPSTLN